MGGRSQRIFLLLRPSLSFPRTPLLTHLIPFFRTVSYDFASFVSACGTTPGLICPPLPPSLTTFERRAIQEELTDATLKIPEYYFAPIHAYADGNLCWDSAMEVGRLRNIADVSFV